MSLSVFHVVLLLLPFLCIYVGLEDEQSDINGELLFDWLDEEEQHGGINLFKHLIFLAY